MEVDELAQLPWDVPETNVVDSGFVSLLTNATKKENSGKSVLQCMYSNKCQQNLNVCKFNSKLYC